MSFSAAHWLMRAAEARAAARLCDDPALRRMMPEIARGYADLAASSYQAAHANDESRKREVRRSGH